MKFFISFLLFNSILCTTNKMEKEAINLLQNHDDLIKKFTNNSTSANDCKVAIKSILTKKFICDGKLARRLFKYNIVFNKDIIDKIHKNPIKSIDLLSNLFFNEKFPEYLEKYGENTEKAKKIFKTVKYMHRIIIKLNKGNNILPINFFIKEITDSVISPGNDKEIKNFTDLINNFEVVAKNVTDKDNSSLHSQFVPKSEAFLKNLLICKNNILKITKDDKKHMTETFFNIIYDRVRISSLGFKIMEEGVLMREEESFTTHLVEYISNLLILSFFNYIDQEQYKTHMQNIKTGTINKPSIEMLLRVIKADNRYPECYRVPEISKESVADFIRSTTGTRNYRKTQNDGYIRGFYNKLWEWKDRFNDKFLAPSDKSREEKKIFEELVSQEKEFVDNFLKEKEDDFSVETEYNKDDEKLFKKKYFSMLRDKLSLDNQYRDIIKNSKIIESNELKEASKYYKLQKLIVLLSTPEPEPIEEKIRQVGSIVVDDGFYKKIILKYKDESERIQKYHSVCCFGDIFEQILKKTGFKNANALRKMRKLTLLDLLRLGFGSLFIFVFILFVVIYRKNLKNKEVKKNGEENGEVVKKSENPVKRGNRLK